MESVAIPVKPLDGAREIVADPDDPACTDDGPTEEAEMVKSVMWNAMFAVVWETGDVPMNAVPVTVAV